MTNTFIHLRRALLTAALAFVGMPSDLAAKTIYVDVTNPSPGKGTQRDPYQSLLAGLEAATAGDSLDVATGIYFEDMTKTQVLAGQLPLTFEFHTAASAVSLTSNDPLNCFARGPGGTYCPTIVPRDDIGAYLEPSGLVYVEEEDLWVGVSDNYDELAPLGAEAASYAVFGFRDQVPPNGRLEAMPLLPKAQALSFPVYDLEGLTAVAGPDGTLDFYATGSWSLDRSGRKDDRWYRFQMLHFQLGSSAKSYVMSKLDWVSDTFRRDLREWVISSSGYPWSTAEVQGLAEKGGINVESLASVAGSDPSLVVGFRGPGFANGSGTDPLLMFTNVPGPNEVPRCQSMGNLPAGFATPSLGFRGLEMIAGNQPPAYVALLGPMGTDHSPIYAAVVEPVSGGLGVTSATQIGCGEGLVPEGIDVEKPLSSCSWVVGMVDDYRARFLKTILEACSPPTQGGSLWRCDAPPPSTAGNRRSP